jgi:nitroimidazol reductase NimA-like FMN-containing flavoprotein (pyridoxamine 5'-phosphate oxidase superfamily)
MNRRNQIAMTAEEQSAYLAAAKTLVLTSIDSHGYPHSVAMWFALIDGLVHMTSFAKAQKVVNMRRNPKVSLLAESGTRYSELRGLLIRGDAEIVDDTELCLSILADVQPRYFGPTDSSVRDVLRKQAAKRVAIRIQPLRVSSWDHTKLGGVY